MREVERLTWLQGPLQLRDSPIQIKCCENLNNYVYGYWRKETYGQTFVRRSLSCVDNRLTSATAGERPGDGSCQQFFGARFKEKGRLF